MPHGSWKGCLFVPIRTTVLSVCLSAVGENPHHPIWPCCLLHICTWYFSYELTRGQHAFFQFGKVVSGNHIRAQKCIPELEEKHLSRLEHGLGMIWHVCPMEGSGTANWLCLLKVNSLKLAGRLDGQFP